MQFVFCLVDNHDLHTVSHCCFMWNSCHLLLVTSRECRMGFYRCHAWTSPCYQVPRNYRLFNICVNAVWKVFLFLKLELCLSRGFISNIVAFSFTFTHILVKLTFLLGTSHVTKTLHHIVLFRMTLFRVKIMNHIICTLWRMQKKMHTNFSYILQQIVLLP